MPHANRYFLPGHLDLSLFYSAFGAFQLFIAIFSSPNLPTLLFFDRLAFKHDHVFIPYPFAFILYLYGFPSKLLVRNQQNPVNCGAIRPIEFSRPERNTNTPAVVRNDSTPSLASASELGT